MNNKHLRSLSWGRMQWGKRKNRKIGKNIRIVKEQ